MFPIEDPQLQRRIVDRILGVVLADNVKARELQSDGTYRRLKPKPGEPVIRSQIEFQNIAREHAEDGPIPQAVPSIAGGHVSGGSVGVSIRAVYIRTAHMQPTTAGSRVADHRCFLQPRSGGSS